MQINRVTTVTAAEALAANEKLKSERDPQGPEQWAGSDPQLLLFSYLLQGKSFSLHSAFQKQGAYLILGCVVWEKNIM